MKCPACSNALLALQVGSLKVDACQGGCGGVWFDAFELQRVDDNTKTLGQSLLRIERDEQIQVDPTRKRECPRCWEIKLRRHLFSPKSRVEVDECPNCGGYWLDDGELAKIRAERTEATQTEKAAQDRAALSSELIRYVYKTRLEQQS